MPPVSSLVDPFAGTTLAAHWADVFGANTVAGGFVTQSATPPNAFTGFRTVTGDYSLVDDAGFVNLSNVVDAGGGATTQAFLELLVDGGTAPAQSLRLGYRGGDLVGQRINTGPAITDVFAITYDPGAHAFVRLRHVSGTPGTVFMETSPTGEDPWTVRGSFADSLLDFSLATLDPGLTLGAVAGAAGTPASARWDHFNVVNQSIQVDGITIPADAGDVTVAQDQLITVDGVAIPVEAGDDVGVGIDQSLSVDAVTVTLDVGQPQITFVLEPLPPTPPTPQGVPLGGYEYRGLRLGAGTPYVVTRREGLLDKPPIRSADHERLQRHGRLPGEEYLDARTIRLRITVTGTTVADYRENLAALRHALAGVGPPEPLLFRLPTVADAGERLLMVKSPRMGVPDDGPSWAQVLVEWPAPDPLIYATDPTERIAAADQTSGGAPSPFIFPLVFGTAAETGRMTVRNNGSFPAPVRMIVTGPCTRPRIANTRTGQVLEANLSLGNGEILVLDSSTRTVLRGGNTNAYSSLVSDDWWDLEPGETSLYFSTLTETGSLRVTFRSAWVT